MTEVDLVGCWQIGKGVFTWCYLPLELVSKFAILRRYAGFSVPKSLGASGVLSVLTLIALPLPLLVFRHDWIAVLLFGTLNAAALDAILLKITHTQSLLGRLLMLTAVDFACLILAGYPTLRYILRHPPVA